jgi:hypothetical protein
MGLTAAAAGTGAASVAGAGADEDGKPKACPVKNGTQTSNSALKHFFFSYHIYLFCSILPTVKKN